MSGGSGNGISRRASVSQDGRWVAFESWATDLVPETIGLAFISRIYLHDRDPDENGVFDEGNEGTTLVSVDANGPMPEGDCGQPVITAAGDLVFFGVGGGASWTGGVYAWSRTTGLAAIVVAYAAGDLDVSDDGRFVSFGSGATNVVPNDTNGYVDTFVLDRNTNAIKRVSESTSGVQANHLTANSAISGDGRHVAFWGYPSNLTEPPQSPDTNGHPDVFVRDRDTLPDGVFDEPGEVRTTRVSIRTDGTEGPGDSYVPAISGDGQYVAFSSSSSLVDGDQGGHDVFLHDRDPDGNGVFDEGNGITSMVSVGLSGVQGDGSSGAPAISSDGRYIAFVSSAANLVGVDTNLYWDAFVRDMQTGLTARVSVGSNCEEANERSDFYPAISGDGHYVAFQSWASNLAPSDGNELGDVFVRDLCPPCIIANPIDETVCEGASVAFTVLHSGQGAFTYQWRRNTVDVPGATNATLSFPSVVPANAGNYDVMVTNSCGTVTSQPAVLAVTPEGGACDDGAACTENDMCVSAVCIGTPVPGCQYCSLVSECDDLNPCTADTCMDPPGICDHSELLGECSDGQVCTIDDECLGGACVGTPQVLLFGDLAPCGGDGNVDVGDILAVLDAFSGIPPCPDPCPP
jgi:Tol biopolymer transport system component